MVSVSDGDFHSPFFAVAIVTNSRVNRMLQNVAGAMRRLVSVVGIAGTAEHPSEPVAVTVPALLIGPI